MFLNIQELIRLSSTLLLEFRIGFEAPRLLSELFYSTDA